MKRAKNEQKKRKKPTQRRNYFDDPPPKFNVWSKKTPVEIEQEEILKRENYVRQIEKNFDASKPLDDIRYELFCIVYTTNTLPRYWAHGSNSYEFAFGYTAVIDHVNEEIDALMTLQASPKKERGGKSLASIKRSLQKKNKEIESMRKSCAGAGSRLLIKKAVRLRINHLVDELAQNITTDRELTYMIMQREDLGAKMAAIIHYDRREQRIREKMDIKHTFDPVKTITIKEEKNASV